ncbi:MAG: glycosyltransferase family 39 protein [Ferruginibacter sp.]
MIRSLPFIKSQNPILPLFSVKMNKPWIFLAMILFIGLSLRVYITFFTDLPHIHQDSNDYFKQANALMNGSYINYFPNGYPALIALVWSVFANNLEVLLWLNIILATVTIYFTYAISKQLFENELLALATAFLLAIMPTQLNIVRWVISEVPTVFFLTAAYLCYLRKSYLLSGILMGFATLIRTEMLLIFALLIVMELLFLRRFNFRLLIGMMASLMLLGFYCYTKTGKFSISGHSKVNIMFSITASGSNIDWKYIDKHPEIKTESDAVKSYLSHMKSEPLQFAKERTANFYELWGVPSPADGDRSKMARLIMGAGNVFMVLFGIAGWWWNRRNFNVLTMILPFFVVTVVHVLMYATPRYTIPVEPFMIILACWMLLKLFSKRSKNINADNRVNSED